MMKANQKVKREVRKYLRRVKAHLGDRSPAEREELLHSIEEHIYELLTQRAIEEPTFADLTAVLTELDPPESYGIVTESKNSSRIGWIALSLLVAGIVIPLAVALIISNTGILLFTTGPLVLVALVLGVYSWREPTGKATVIGVAAVVIVAVFVSPVRRSPSGQPEPEVIYHETQKESDAE